MKLLTDFFPVLLFFVIYWTLGIYPATIAVIIAAIAQVLIFKFMQRRLEPMMMVSVAIIVVFGGLTLILHDRSFIMWKPTIINWAFAAAFIASQFIGQRPLIARMLGEQIQLTAPVWQRLNWMWAIFFLLAGLANLAFVFPYQAAEAALLAALPQLTELNEFDCLNAPLVAAQSLCETAKTKEFYWASFKTFGLMGMTLVFVVLQAIYLMRQSAIEVTPNPAGNS